MATNYPAGLDAYAAHVDNVTTVIAAHVNDPSDAIEAIEAELGLDPAGAEATVVARLEYIENSFDCAFLAANTVADVNVTGDGTQVIVDFDTEIFDLGADFAADVFTAPATGTYQFNVAVSVEDLAAAHTICFVWLVTTNRTYILANGFWQPTASPGGIYLACGSTLADMDLGETAHVVLDVRNGAKVIDVTGAAIAGYLYTYFSGHRVS